MKIKLLLILLIIITAIPSILPLLHFGFFQSDDGEWMIIRFSAFHQAFRDGQIPVRFLPRLNYEYGYPVANFLYPGFMYLAEPIHLLGVGFINTVKIIFALSMIGSAVFIFLWLSKFFDEVSSLIGAIFYIYSPYHLYDLYKRGSIGEVLSLAVVPFIFWQLSRKSFFWSSIGIALLITSHNTLALLFLPLIILYMLLNIFIMTDKKKLLYQYIGILAIGVGIASFYWVPAIFELKYTIFSKTAVSNFNHYFSDLPIIGISTIFVFVLAFVFLIKKTKILNQKLALMFFAIGIISLFFSSSLSSFLWKIMPVSFIQFPFRFLSVVILSSSFLAACFLSVLSLRLKLFTSLVLLFIIAFSSKSFIFPSQFFEKNDTFYSTNEGTTNVLDEYMPVWVRDKPTKRFDNKVEIIEGTGEINNLVYNSKKNNFEVFVKENSKLRINTIYYPGWKAFINGKEVNIDYSNNKGVIDISVNKGENKIKLIFSETPLRLISNALSLVSFLMLIILSIRKIKFYEKFNRIF